MRHASTILHSSRRLGILLVAVTFLLLPNSRAQAQGTSGAFPDPISTREMERYCDLLDMSDQQRQGIGLAHDEYLEAFRGLREGPIEEYLQTYGARMGFNFSTQGDQKEIEDSVRKRNELMTRIAGLDNRLFDQVQTVLTEDQIAAMPRVRQARERARYRAGISRMAMFSSPGARVDLSEIVADLDLDPATAEAADPVVASYERSLTAELRKLYEGASTIQLDLQSKMRDLGFADGRPRDRESRDAFAQAIGAAFSELNQSLSELSSKVTDLNKRTVVQLAHLMPDDDARDLRTHYYDRAFPGVPAGAGEAGRRFAEIKRMDDVEAKQREQIDQIRTGFNFSLDSLVEQMVKLAEERPQRGFEFRFNRDRNNDAADEYAQKMDRLRGQRTDLIDRTIDQVNAVLGDELTQRLDARIARGEVPGQDGNQVVTEGVFVTAVGDGGGGTVQALTITASGPLDSMTAEGQQDQLDTYLPGPIGRRDLDRYAKYLGVSSDMQPILAGLLEDYRDQFDVLRGGSIKSVRDKSRSLWAIDEASGEMTPPTRKDIDELYRLRRAALHDIEALDDQFFTNLETVLPEGDYAEAIQRIRFARQRDIYSRGRDTGGFRMFGGPGRRGRGGGTFTFIGGPGGGSSEAVVDLSDLVDDLNLDDQQRERIDGALAGYEKDVTARFQQAFETTMRFNQATEGIRADATEVVGEGDQRDVRMNMNGDEMREVMRGDGAAESEIRRGIIELNRETLDKFQDLLSPDAMARLRDAYNRKSFPDIYNDPGSAEAAVTAVYNLPDLGPSQRTELDGIAAEYRSEYEGLSQQMVEIRLHEPIGGGFGGRGGRGGRGGGRGGGPGNGNIDFQAIQQRQRDMEKLRFDRKDLCDKTRNRLKALLTADQQARLADLLEPKDVPEGNIIRIGG